MLRAITWILIALETLAGSLFALLSAFNLAIPYLPTGGGQRTETSGLVICVVGAIVFWALAFTTYRLMRVRPWIAFAVAIVPAVAGCILTLLPSTTVTVRLDLPPPPAHAP